MIDDFDMSVNVEELIEDDATFWDTSMVEQPETADECFQMILALYSQYDGTEPIVDDMADYAELGRILIREQELEEVEDND